MKKLTETLASARAAMIEETRRLQGEGRRQVYNQPVAGVPIDSEYVIFIVDTSGSMQSQNWRYAEEKLGEVLNIYPKLKGIQVMDDEGGYMFSDYRGKWIPDSPARRKAILERLPQLAGVLELEPVRGHHRRGPLVLDRATTRSASTCSATSSRDLPSRKSWTRSIASIVHPVRVSGWCASMRSGSRFRASTRSRRACATRP